MDRRQFIKTTAASTVLAGTSLPVLESTANACTIKKREIGAPAVLKTYTAGDHRRRLVNIAICNKSIRKCMRKHLITDYLPGQAIYNIGEYPSKKPWEINEYDRQELDRLAGHGIKLIQLHECWNDSLRLFGGNKFKPVNPQGFQRFVDMVHARGMKLIVYISTGWFPPLDPDFREGWARKKKELLALWNNYVRCSPASSGWRAYLLKNVVRILDDYGVDGLYNDYGYRKLATHPDPPTKDEILAFKETPKHDGALGDLLSLIYAEVKRRGGIVKLHADQTNRLNTGSKVYDYLWVGEDVFNVDKLRNAVKNHPPYVVPCLDMRRTKLGSEDELYLNSIPYMQFPLLQAGKPFTGERLDVEGIKYYDKWSYAVEWIEWFKAVREHYRRHKLLKLPCAHQAGTAFADRAGF